MRREVAVTGVLSKVGAFSTVIEAPGPSTRTVFSVMNV